MKLNSSTLTKLSTPFLLLIILSCSSIEPYKNPRLPVEKRVEDLISRMTLEEKIRQMTDIADSIPRLGIPVYNWWNEGLHGVARAGTATVFPQAIGLAATFNDSLMFETASVISDEFRAKYNHFQKMGERDRYKGLTVWSPNINIFRDPRWGRGQETYGEDPYLTSLMGVEFVKGMQGDDPKYYKTIATPKHYVVHSGPEPLRHKFNVDVSQRDFMDTYLPAFKACVVEGNAQSVMGAYNRFRGESCSGSPYLLTRILREKWGFDGYVVSDCGAIWDIFAHHKIARSPAEAAAIGVKSGCDLNCGFTYLHLKTAIDSGYIEEAELDIALKRLFTARFKLGMFDPVDKVPYNKIPYEVNDCAPHRQLSLEAAREAIVLLKNENNFLPLKNNIKSIAVIGPNANDPEVMYGNYNGFPSKYVTPFEGIKQKVGEETEVYYARGCNLHEDFIDKELLTWRNLSSNGKPGLEGEYFNNRNLEGSPFAIRIDSVMRFGWFNRAPVPGMNVEDFSIRWQGTLTAPEKGKYKIIISADDGVRLFIDDKLIVNTWEKEGWNSTIVELFFEENSNHSIKLDYYQHNWGARVKLEWSLPEKDFEKEALDIAKKSDVVVFVGGLSSQLEGEEMKVNLSGFHGGDRTSIDLPAVQVDMLKKIHALGKPVILVLMSGSAVAVNWADENIPAIIEAWYPGQEGGTAIADVLFGHYNPAGRLPVTFYKSIDQLPPFEDYDMKNRTYRYFEEEPLYEFGYGLSYTTFEYSNLVVPEHAKTGDEIEVRVNVENIGDYPGDEVVQLYLKHLDSPYPVPIHALKAFKRVHLDANKKRTVIFTLSGNQLSVIDDNNQRVVLPGKVQLFLGGKQPDKLSLELNKILTTTVEIEGEPNIIDRLD